MILVYKGKGILVPLFLGVSVIGAAIISGILHRNVEALKDVEISFKYIMATGLFISFAWTKYARNTYYIKDGKKIILEKEENSFCFIRMKYWADIFFIGGVCFLIDQILF